MNNWKHLGYQDDITSSAQSVRADSVAILERAMEIINSVEYPVTLRWVFYGLWQEGFYNDVKPTKKNSSKFLAYSRCSSLLSRVRHGELYPIELIDDRRDPVHRTAGFETADEWLSSLKDNIRCNIDKMANQDYYVMIAFEAEAMLSQFKHITEPYGVSLWPLSGQTSIPYKKRIARHIEWAYEKFGKPVVFLYFGDFDKAGHQIPETAFTHIRKWCGVPFDAYRVGLSEEDITRLNLPDDPKEQGKYQWEALRDKDAREMITSALDSLLCLVTLAETKEQEKEMTENIKELLTK